MGASGIFDFIHNPTGTITNAKMKSAARHIKTGVRLERRMRRSAHIGFDSQGCLGKRSDRACVTCPWRKSNSRPSSNATPSAVRLENAARRWANSAKSHGWP